MHYISKTNLFRLLDALKSEYDVFVPVKKNEQRFYKKYDQPSADITIGEVRPFEPLKAFFTRSREIVANGFKDELPHVSDKPYAIVGVKACDLKGFKIQDFVFGSKEERPPNNDPRFCIDPTYIKNRKENLIISSDCTCAIDTCFCLALGIKPHPQEDFDINLSDVIGGYEVETGSKKGEELVKKYSSLFKKSNEKYADAKEKQRSRVIKEVEENIRKNDIPLQDRFENIIERNWESDIWTDECKTCVECGACTIICPTCHCFFLYDQKSEEKMARLRVWDSCMLKNYAKVAGGANPRPKLYMRLRNRFDKKFDFFPKVADVYACTGCGRCVSACPAKIDIRKVLKRLVNA